MIPVEAIKQIINAPSLCLISSSDVT